MPFTIPAEVYIEFEEALGAEKAKKIVKAFETIIDAEIANKWAQTKFELRDKLLKEFVTKKEFETKIESLRAELSSKIESVRIELSKEIENAVLKIEKRFTILFLVLLFAVIFLNRGALEFILKILKVI
jgi:HD-GYP domain-containing protein (c-di-GMP phosphodiesterase class II)